MLIDNSMIPENFLIKVLDVIDHPSGDVCISLELSEDFIQFFCKYKNLIKFDENAFQEWFSAVLVDYIEKQKQEIQKRSM